MRPIIHIDPAKTDPNYGKPSKPLKAWPFPAPVKTPARNPTMLYGNAPDRTLKPYKAVRRGRPRNPQVVSFQAPGDMAHLLTAMADHAGVSTSEMVRRIMTIALETPDMWLDVGEAAE